MEQKTKLLLVDDEERIVNLLRMVFRADYEVHVATSGQQALEIIGKHAIDVIVSDQRMPGMLGIELLAEVRRLSPGTMRILLTGYSDLAAIVGSVNNGEVFRFMSKPWAHEEIKTIIAEAAQAARETSGLMLKSESQPVGATGPGSRPELLLLDDSISHRQEMAKILGSDYIAHGASSIADAMKVLEAQDIGVIVSEAVVGGRDAGELLRVLKQHYPAITTVMLTNTADADLVIKLINGAQIFRFATKPIRPSVFQLCVSAAMKEHQRFRANPALAARYRVAKLAEPDDEALAASVVNRMGSLRSRLARFMGAAVAR